MCFSASDHVRVCTGMLWSRIDTNAMQRPEHHLLFTCEASLKSHTVFSICSTEGFRMLSRKQVWSSKAGNKCFRSWCQLQRMNCNLQKSVVIVVIPLRWKKMGSLKIHLVSKKIKHVFINFYWSSSNSNIIINISLFNLDAVEFCTFFSFLDFFISSKFHKLNVDLKTSHPPLSQKDTEGV